MAYAGAVKRAFEIGKKEIGLSKPALNILGVSVFIGLTAAGAFVRIYLPFTPVPVTLQTFFVLLAGAVLGRKLGSLSQFSYVALGALGLPIFSGALGGISRLAGPTGGYLVGFIVAAWIVGMMLKGRASSFLKIVLAMTAGNFVIYLFGVLWLSFIIHIGIWKALLLGAFPFILGDAIKLLAAASLYQGIQKRSREVYPNS